MFRLLCIVSISFCAVVPFLALFHRFLGMDDGIAGYLSFFFAWLITPIVLGNLWKVLPDLSYLPVDKDDPIMQRYVAKSKSQIDRFINGLNESKLEAFIKFPYEFDGEVEHVWGVAHHIKGDCIISSLESMPVGGLSEEVLERLSFLVADIEDWMLVDSKGNVQGGYSMLAMAIIYKRDYGKLPKQYPNDLKNFVDFSVNRKD